MKNIIIKNYIITILFLLIIIIFSNNIDAQTIIIDEINFNNAEVQDVIRSIADIYNKNVVLDNSVTGKITISLEDVGFEETLRLITNAKDLSYKIDNNTVFVASPEKIKNLYESQKMKIVNLENIKPEIVINLLNKMFNELRIAQLPNDNQLIIKGIDEDISEVLSLINRIDQKTEDIIDFELVSVYPENYEMIISSLNALYFDLKVVENDKGNKLLIHGKRERVKEAIKVVSRLNVLDETKVTEIIGKDQEQLQVNITTQNIVDYFPIEDASRIIESNFSGLIISSNPVFKEMILNGPANTVKKATEFLDKIDRPQRQVMIEVRVEEISRSYVEDFGLKEKNRDNEYGSVFPRIKFIKEGDRLDAIGMQWPDILDYLKRNSKSETLANPHLITLNGQEGNLLIGNRIPVKTVNSDGTESIKYIEAGITLEFLPWISEENIIRLDVSPTVSSLGDEKYEGFPIIQTREVETTLNLKDGETFAIGGLIQESDTISKSQVPYLSKIPILGELFKRRDNDNSKTELLIFITPKIIGDYKNVEQEEQFEYLNYN